MDELVDDVKVVICSFLDSISLSYMGVVCKYFHTIAANDLWWKERVNKEYNGVTKYNTCATFREQYIHLHKTVKLGLSLCAMRCHKDTVMHLLIQGQKANEHDLVFVICTSEVDVYEFPTIKPLITQQYFAENRMHIRIHKPEALDWLVANGITITEWTLYAVAEVSEDKALAVIGWYIQHNIQFGNSAAADLAARNNYLRLYKVLATIGVQTTSDSCYFCCTRGYIEMLELLKSQGIMPLAQHVWETYRDAKPEPRMRTLHWLSANGYKANTYLINAALKAADFEVLSLFADTYNFRSIELRTVIACDNAQIFAWLFDRGIINSIPIKDKPKSRFIVEAIAELGAANIADYLVQHNLLNEDQLQQHTPKHERIQLWLNGTALSHLPPLNKGRKRKH